MGNFMRQVIQFFQQIAWEKIQYCKAIILQLKINKIFLIAWERSEMEGEAYRLFKNHVNQS